MYRLIFFIVNEIELLPEFFFVLDFHMQVRTVALKMALSSQQLYSTASYVITFEGIFINYGMKISLCMHMHFMRPCMKTSSYVFALLRASGG